MEDCKHRNVCIHHNYQIGTLLAIVQSISLYFFVLASSKDDLH